MPLGDSAFLLRLTCRDTGVGIAPENIARVCDNFFQGSEDQRRGTGLGLAISKRLTELMQGELRIQSVLGHGAAVTVTVRLEVAAAPPAPGEPARETRALADLSDAEGRPWRVLLADDSVGNRQVISLFLENQPVHLEEVENGQDALDRFKKGDIDIVLMDHVMPIMDGMTAVRAMRQHEWTTGAAPTPIIGITARAFPEDEAACLEAGCTAYLSKPVRRSALIAAMQGLLGRRG
jgi:CheY-like chemotaxis protein